MSERQERCESCRFWRPPAKNEDGWDRGQCRRHAPTAVEAQYAEHFREDWAEGGMHDPLTAVFPLTFPDMWCGEFQPVPRVAQLAQPSVNGVPGKTISELFVNTDVAGSHMLCIRTINALEGGHIFSPGTPRRQLTKVSDLLQLTECDLLEYRNIGEGSLDYIKRVLAAHGLRLKDDPVSARQPIPVRPVQQQPLPHE